MPADDGGAHTASIGIIEVNLARRQRARDAVSWADYDTHDGYACRYHDTDTDFGLVLENKISAWQYRLISIPLGRRCCKNVMSRHAFDDSFRPGN